MKPAFQKPLMYCKWQKFKKENEYFKTIEISSMEILASDFKDYMTKNPGY
jgi:hypothetical protein